MMMRKRSLVLWAVLLIVATGRLFGQAGATGVILGTVTDSSGAIIPNVKVTVTNTLTNVAYRTVTGSAGDYQAPSLNPGTYSVSAEIKGFEKSVTNSFNLAVDQKVRIDLSLKPGAVTETMQVTAQAVELDTDSAALSQLVSQQQVEELPLNGRNFMQLLLIGAGAVTVGGEQGTMRQGEGAAISVNGGRPEGNNYTLDGLVNTDAALVTPAVILSQDAIQEFKVESGTYPAEYGFSASQVNIVSKGGTNKIHGSIFEDDRNDAFDAKPFPTAINENSGVATSNPVLRQNQFGFVADGPVYIPKLYDGRNRSFWMANYEGWRINNGNIAEESVPNPAVLQGNFSAETYPALPTAKLNGQAHPLPGGLLPAYGTDDCTALIASGYNCMPVNPATGLPFPNNTIPASSFTSRLGQVAIQKNFWAAPTIANQNEGVTNLIKPIPGLLKTNQQTYRGDQNLGRLGSVFFRFTKSTYQNSSLYNSGSLDYGIETYFENQKNWEISHTINLGPKNVNTFRFGYLDAEAPEGNLNAPTAADVSALGFSGVFTSFGYLQSSWPELSPTQYASGGGSGNAYSGSSNPNWEYQDAFTSIHGKHTLGFGADYRTYHLVRNLDDDFLGTYGFSSNQIQTNSHDCPNAPVSVGGAAPVSLCGTGNAFADIMLGYYQGASNFSPGPLSPTGTAGNPQDHVFNYFAPYAEDEWKVTRKLTLNLGLRWDFHQATYEASNHFFWLDTKNPIGGLCYADPKLSTNGVAPGVGVAPYNSPILRYCGSVPHPGSKTPFAPRFGFNYRLTDKTVVRGGYGIFFDSYEGREIDDSADIYPYSIRNNLTPATVSSLDSYKTTNQLFPNFTTLGPFPESTLSFLAVIESENPLNPYVQSWTISAERELARNTTLEVNYIGTHAVHLLDRHDLGQPYNVPSGSVAFCQDAVKNGTYTATLWPCGPYSQDPNGNFTRLQYPNFNGFYIDSDFHGYSHYNAMNVKFEHRASDLAVTGVYTFSRSSDNKSAAAGVGASGTGYQGFEDNHNQNLDYGPSDFDVDNRFVSSFVWQLPIGRGKKIAGGVGRLTDIAIGGWEITGITTFQTGFPYSIPANDIDGIQALRAPRANLISGCDTKKHPAGKYEWLNIACFSEPDVATTGNSKRNFLRQPGINNWDMGFGKGFALGEHAQFRLTVDTFNTFNHHQYAGDVGGLVVGGSGGNEVIDNGITDSPTVAGKITGASSPRILQLAGKITF